MFSYTKKKVFVQHLCFEITNENFYVFFEKAVFDMKLFCSRDMKIGFQSKPTQIYSTDFIIE